MLCPEGERLGGVGEVDQAEVPFRADNSFFDPVKSGKILIAGAVEVIDRGTNQAKPRRKRAKYLDTRSGRIRLAAIPDNSAASIEALVRQREARNHAAHRRAQIVSRAHRLPTRPAHGPHDADAYGPP